MYSSVRSLDGAAGTIGKELLKESRKNLSFSTPKSPVWKGIKDEFLIPLRFMEKYSRLPEILLLCTEMFPILLAAADGPISGKHSPFAGRSTQE